MVKRVMCPAIVLGLALTLTAFGDDKIGNEKPSAILPKVKAEMAKKKGYHVVETVTYPDKGAGRPLSSGQLKGVVKGEYAFLNGHCYSFFKGQSIALR